MPFDEHTFDAGDCLHFRMIHYRRWIPVVISRAAMEGLFGVRPGQSLVRAYQENTQEIEEKVRPLIQRSVNYDSAHPLRIGVCKG